MSPVTEFQKKYSGDLRLFLQTELGQALMQALHNLRMLPICDALEHQVVFRCGAISGYEQCEKNILTLSTLAISSKSEPEMNYGVVEKK